MQLRPARKSTHLATIPDTVGGKKIAERISGITRVAEIAVIRFQDADRVDGFEAPQPFEHIHSNLPIRRTRGHTFQIVPRAGIVVESIRRQRQGVSHHDVSGAESVFYEEFVVI